MNIRCLSRNKLQLHTVVFVALVIAAGAEPALAHSHAIYIPQITIVPTVLETDGVTPVTYDTKDGPSYWRPGLPISQSSVIKLNAFVTTGGADLARVIVRLDNTRIATLTSSPWSANLNAATLSPGNHMVEVWAQAAGDPKQTNTTTLSFYVANFPSTIAQGQDATPPQFSVMGSVESLNPGQNPAYKLSESDDLSNSAPDFLAGKPLDVSAMVELHSTNSDVDNAFGDHRGAVTLSSPVVLFCSRPAGSTAVTYAYSITRDGETIVAPTAPLSLQYTRIRIEPRTADRPGLRPGNVTLWIWGINSDGQPSGPQRQDLVITGE